MKNRIQYLFFKVIPKSLLSKLTGLFANLKIPKFILSRLILYFCNHYQINVNEFVNNVGHFNTFNDFFLRYLKPEFRPINNNPSTIISPVDCKVLEHGIIKNNLLFQVKGLSYKLNELIRETNISSLFLNGSYITLYLRPTDCHHIFSPFDGKIFGYEYIPGKLFTVNLFGVNNIRNLYCINERLSLFMDSNIGKIALIAVGATNVGKIVFSSLNNISTNKYFSKYDTNSNLNIPVSKGDELGYFELGSTVILLFQSSKVELDNFYFGQEIKYGMPIASIMNNR